MGVGRVEFWTKAFVRLLLFSVWVFGVWVWPDSCYDFRFQLHQSTSRVNAPSKNTIPNISTVQRKHIDFEKLTKKRMQVVFRKLGEISSCFLYLFNSTQPYLSVLRCIHACTRMNHAKIKDASIMEDMLLILTTRVPSTATRLSKTEFLKEILFSIWVFPVTCKSWYQTWFCESDIKLILTPVFIYICFFRILIYFTYYLLVSMHALDSFFCNFACPW